MVGSGLRSPAQVRDRLADTAPNPNDDPLLGAGMIQADRAVPITGVNQLLWVVLIVGAV